MRRKVELYRDEQNQIIEALIKILGLDENNSCLLYDIDNDETKINEINKLIPTIRKYFSFSSIWGASLPDQTKRPWLSIVRQLTKRHYEMLSCDYRIVKDGQTIRTKKYIFLKKI